MAQQTPQQVIEGGNGKIGTASPRPTVGEVNGSSFRLPLEWSQPASRSHALDGEVG
jgi:hypothetical protein